MKTLNIPLETKSLAAGASAPLVIPLEAASVMRALVVDVRATVTWAGAVTLFEEAFARSLRLELLLKDSDAIFFSRGDVWRNYRRMVLNPGCDDLYTEFAAGAGATTARWRTVIPFADVRLPNLDDTAYDLALASSPRLTVNFDGTSSLTATAGAHTFDGMTVEATVCGVPRPTNVPPIAGMVRRFKQYGLLTEADIPAGTNDGRHLKLDTGSLVRRIFVQTRERTSGTRPRTDGLLSRTGIYLNGTKFGFIPWEQARVLGQDSEKPATSLAGTNVWNFDTGGAIDPQELLNLQGMQGIVGLEVATPAALANGLEVAYLDETILFPRGA